MPDRLRAGFRSLAADSPFHFSMSDSKPAGAYTATVLAFDFGARRIGVAVGDRALGIPHPLTTITAGGEQQRYAALAALLAEWRPAVLVVGLPLQRDGSEHAMTRRCRNFARQLQARFQLPVVLIDEHLTSATADTLLKESGVAARKRKPRLDQVAAQQILHDYFESLRDDA